MITQKLDDLRPCPFCGQDDWRVSTHHQDDMIVCGNCTAEAPLQFWNERPLEDALQAEVEALYLLLIDNPQTKKLADKMLELLRKEKK